MGEFFPEIKSQQQLVTNVIREEEASFLRTLDQGLQLLDKVVAETNGEIVSGAKAFELYDTFGFPKDLTALILKEKGMSFKESEFDASMQAQKARSRAASEVSTEDWSILIPGNTETFVGYDRTENEVKITRIRKVDSKKDGILYQIVLDNTPFYPEGGGQVGDKGTLVSANEIITILDTKKENNLILHFTKQLPENTETSFKAKVTTNLRIATSKNHSATHLMHLALRDLLGTHVEQKGSLVNPNYLRFDFSHFSKVSDEEIREVEAMVNRQIEEQLQLIEHRNIPIKEALEKGAMALFGEKYGDSVRMIEFGESKELCGGIHVNNTSEIWHFKIISEGAVAAGIRRIEAITGDAVKNFYQNQEHILAEIKGTLKNPQDILKSVITLQEDNTKLKKQLEQLVKEKVAALKATLVTDFIEINGINFLAKKVDLSMAATKDLTQAVALDKGNAFVVLVSVEDDLPNIHCYISKELVAEKGLNAGNVIRELGKLIDGNGGGQPFFASGKGRNPAGINQVLEKAEDFVK
jgi:alanyl-tRNA synthetase